MPSINARSLAPAVHDWLADSRQPRILHVFDHACNLINESREVLSIVTPQIGNGPFNLVLADDIGFSHALNIESSIVITSDQLILGDLTVNIANARLWNPRPDWERLRAEKDHLSNQLRQLQVTDDSVQGLATAVAKSTDPRSLISGFSSALAHADLSSARNLASRLAGLGIGLTPAGDDILMGAMYAAWIIHPLEDASVLLQEIANTAASLTTSISAAWLRSAGKGEAGLLWHQFFDALLSSDADSVQSAMDKIFFMGHTSGADALVGFFATMTTSLASVESKAQ